MARLGGIRAFDNDGSWKCPLFLPPPSAPRRITIDDPLLSRKHAAVEVLGSAFIQVWDLASRNGTFINGSRVTTLRKLAPGDVIGVGGTRLRIVVEVDHD